MTLAQQRHRPLRACNLQLQHTHARQTLRGRSETCIAIDELLSKTVSDVLGRLKSVPELRSEGYNHRRQHRGVGHGLSQLNGDNVCQ